MHGKSKMRAIPLVLLAAFTVLLLSGTAVGLTSNVTIVWGNVTFGTSNATGAVLSAYLGGKSIPEALFTVGSQGTGVPTGYYQADVSCDNSTSDTSTVFLKVWGINGTAVGCIANGFRTLANISVTALANSVACSYANACSSGYCCSGGSNVNTSGGSGTCQASACAAATTTDTGGGGSSSGGGGGGGAAAPTAPAAPSQATIDAIKDSLPASFKAADAVVEYKTVAAAEVKAVPVAADAVTKTLTQVETVLKTDEAKQALEAIKQAISSGGATTVSVKKTVEVVKATNKGTGESVTVSLVKLSVTAPANQALKNVEVLEVIPKAAASNVNKVTFLGEKPVVLEADPVVKWSFPEILQGQKKDFSYTINTDMSNLGTNTVGVSKKVEAAAQPPAQPAPPTKEAPAVTTKPVSTSYYAFVALAAVVVIGGWLFLKSRKKVMR